MEKKKLVTPVSLRLNRSPVVAAAAAVYLNHVLPSHEFSLHPTAAMTRLVCQDCGRAFLSEFNYSRHRKLRCSSGKNDLKCEKCKKVFARSDNLARHMTRFHPLGSEQLYFACGICDKSFPNRTEVKSHRQREHSFNVEFELKESAHAGQRRSYRSFFPDHVNTLDEGLVETYYRTKKLMDELAVTFKIYKINLCMGVELHRLDEFGEPMQEELFAFTSFACTVSRGTDMRLELCRMCGDIERSVDEFLYCGSGWVVTRPVYLDAHVGECDPLAGSGGCGLHTTFGSDSWRKTGLVPTNLPPAGKEELMTDKGLCFYYAVAAGIMGPNVLKEDLDYFIKYNIKRLSDNATRPVAVNDIDQFEKVNSHLDLAINVIYWDEDGIALPVRASPNLQASKMIVLQLFRTNCPITPKDPASCLLHYSLVIDPSSVLATRREDIKGKVRKVKTFICWNCFNKQYSQEAHNNHVSFCHKNGSQRIVMPAKGEKRQFEEEGKSNKHAFRSAYMIFYDFEALQVDPVSVCSCTPEVMENTRRLQAEKLKSRETKMEESLELIMNEGELAAEWEMECYERKKKGQKRMPPRPRPYRPPRVGKVCTHKTYTMKEQPPIAYSLVVVDRNGKIWEECSYAGEDAAEHFVFTVLRLEKKYIPRLTPGVPMEKMTSKERQQLRQESICYLCDGDMPNFQKRVLDHDHLTGEFLGVAHASCNASRREEAVLTLFAHNFTGYDSHFLVKVFSKFPELIDNITAIPVNTQRFKSFTINKRLVFLDSFQFLSDSLSNLVDALRTSGSTFNLLNHLAESEEEKKVLLRKGVYPYSFATSLEALKEQKVLPSRTHFASDLTREECSLDDYAHAKQVWETFECENMFDYTLLYMKTDVILLAEVMLDFRNNVWDSFQLDLCRYLSLPHLSMDIMLKKTGVQMDLIDDQEMADLLKKNIRGGHSFVNLRHVEHCNGEEEEGYSDMEEGEVRLKKKKIKQTLLYVDANNLYGGSMKLPLPLKDFRWMTEKEIKKFDPQSMITKDEDAPGYILEVDLDYPEQLHLEHNSLPLAPEHIDVSWEDLGLYSRRCAAKLMNKKTHKARKLSATFNPRKKYLLHGYNLLLYLKLGLRLKKIHRIITFTQSSFVKSFIEECTEKRKIAPTKSEQTMWKLVCNSVYGKFIESLEKRMACLFDRSPARARASITSPLYKGSFICDKNMSITFHKKKELAMKQCWAVGFSILEISKYVMQRLYYEEIQPCFGVGNVAVVMSDTDSFLLALKGVDREEAMERLAPVMDFSNLDPQHSLYDKSRNKEPGFLKNELPNSEILEVVALKSKTYALRTDDGVKVTAKGVVGAVRKKLPFSAFKACVDEMKAQEVVQHTIRSKDHINRLIQSRKIAFTSFDDKRFQLCSLHSVPYGSKYRANSEETTRYDYCDTREDAEYAMKHVCYFCNHPNKFY